MRITNRLPIVAVFVFALSAVGCAGIDNDEHSENQNPLVFHDFNVFQPGDQLFMAMGELNSQWPSDHGMSRDRAIAVGLHASGIVAMRVWSWSGNECNGNSFFRGTGVLTSGNRFVTAWHVISDAVTSPGTC